MIDPLDHEELRRLLREIGHEVRNPLAGIRGAAQLLASVDHGTERCELSALIVSEVDRLNALIDRWQSLSGPSHMRSINPHEALEHVFRLFAAEWRGRIQLKRDYDVSLPLLRADLNRLIQALINLLRNAAQAGARTVWLRSRPGPRRRDGTRTVWIEVEDDGTGVPATLRARLFEPLATSRAEGSGLGLAIVAAVAAEHNGAVDFDSTAGCTRFRLLLPV